MRVELCFFQCHIRIDVQQSEVAVPQSLLNNLSPPSSCMCKASFICNICLFLEPSIMVGSPTSGDAGWSMHGWQPLIFCLSSSDSCLVLTDSCIHGPLCFPNVLQTTTAGNTVYHSKSPVWRFLDLGQLSPKGRLCAETSPDLVFFCKFSSSPLQDLQRKVDTG